MTIKTEHWLKPIPERNFDWSAVDADTYDGPGCPIGWGPTEAAAIADLKRPAPRKRRTFMHRNGLLRRDFVLLILILAALSLGAAICLR